jgi:hypothetical protein
VTSDCGWEQVDSFRSLKEYEGLLDRIRQQVNSGSALAVELDAKRRWGTSFEERWFRCGHHGDVWRLVAPDPPFHGVFKPV